MIFHAQNTTFYNSWFFGQSRDFWYRVLYRKRYFLPPQSMPMIIKREPVVIFRKCINNWRCYYVLIPKVTARGLLRKIKELRSAIYKNMTYQKHVVQKTQNIHYETIASKEILVNALLAVNWRELFCCSPCLCIYELTAPSVWLVVTFGKCILWLSF